MRGKDNSHFSFSVFFEIIRMSDKQNRRDAEAGIYLKQTN
jgi:hypothetical protein